MVVMLLVQGICWEGLTEDDRIDGGGRSVGDGEDDVILAKDS